MGGELKHIGFILDGNRRWAKAHGLQALLGHKSGYELAKKISSILPKYGIKYVTYYVFSTENWNRSEEEVSYLMNLFRDMFHDSIEYMMERGIRIIAIGDLERLPEDLLSKLKNIVEATKSNSILTLTVALSYGGRDEIVRAVKKIAQDSIDKKIKPSDITEDFFSTYLDTSDVPYPDAIVRTGEKRISNFLIWQLAYSEIFFIDKLWPDFNESDLQAIIEECTQRKRRYGK